MRGSLFVVLRCLAAQALGGQAAYPPVSFEDPPSNPGHRRRRCTYAQLKAVCTEKGGGWDLVYLRSAEHAKWLFDEAEAAGLDLSNDDGLALGYSSAGRKPFYDLKYQNTDVTPIFDKLWDEGWYGDYWFDQSTACSGDGQSFAGFHLIYNSQKEFCVRITTGTARWNDGTLDVDLSFDGVDGESAARGSHSKGEIVLDECYPEPILWVSVKNPSNNAWTGTIEYSVYKRSFSAMKCSEGCNNVALASSLVVDGDSDSATQADLQCFEGIECRLTPGGPKACPWATHHNGPDGMALCEDGVYSNWRCGLDGHGQRKQCPPNNPYMQAEKICGGGLDYCCSTTNSDPRPCQAFCLRITTGASQWNDGTLKVRHSLAPPPSTPAADGSFNKAAIVVEKCYPQPITWVTVQNPTSNAWTGKIEYSVDYGRSFSALVCSEGCNNVALASSLVVDGDSNSATQADLQCFEGIECTLTPQVKPGISDWGSCHGPHHKVLCEDTPVACDGSDQIHFFPKKLQAYTRGLISFPSGCDAQECCMGDVCSNWLYQEDGETKCRLPLMDGLLSRAPPVTLKKDGVVMRGLGDAVISESTTNAWIGKVFELIRSEHVPGLRDCHHVVVERSGNYYFKLPYEKYEVPRCQLLALGPAFEVLGALGTDFDPTIRPTGQSSNSDLVMDPPTKDGEYGADLLTGGTKEDLRSWLRPGDPEVYESDITKNVENVQRVMRVCSKAKFAELFPVANKGAGPGEGESEGLEAYSYTNFLKAVWKFRFLCGEYEQTDDLCKLELAASFAQFARETGENSGWRAGLGAAEGRDTTWHPIVELYRQGLYEHGENTSPGSHCHNEGLAGKTGCKYCSEDGDGADYPCVDGKQYSGRGAKQLSWNYNYGQYSQDMFGDKNILLDDPERIKNDWHIIASGYWFYMKTQSPKPSMHDVVVGRWKPSADDVAANRLPGSGVLTMIINGAIECGQRRVNHDAAQNRADFYKAFAGNLGVLDSVPSKDECDDMEMFDVNKIWTEPPRFLGTVGGTFIRAVALRCHSSDKTAVEFSTAGSPGDFPPLPDETFLRVPMLRHIVGNVAGIMNRMAVDVHGNPLDFEDQAQDLETCYKCPTIGSRTYVPTQLKGTIIPSQFREAGAHYCVEAHRLVATKDYMHKLGVRCCYGEDNYYMSRWPSRFLVESPNPNSNWIRDEDKEVEVLACPGEKCAQFEALRRHPASSSKTFGKDSCWNKPKKAGGGWGDPHCQTIDGLRFECNFHGEAVWASCGNFAVHALAEQVEGSQATIITRFAVRKGEEVFEASLNASVDSERSSQTGLTPNRYSVKLNHAVPEAGAAADDVFGSSLIMTSFDNVMTIEDGTGSQLKATFKKQLIVLQVSLSDYCEGIAEGLSGNNNADPSDDLQARNATTVLPENSTSEQIYSHFITSWLITEANESLFSTFVAGDPSFTPAYADVMDTTNCPAACNGDKACCFDSELGGEEFVEAFTASVAAIQETNAQAIGLNDNMPPAFEVAPSQVFLADGEQVSLTYVASDADNISSLTCAVCPGETSYAPEYGVQCAITGLGSTSASLNLTATSLPGGFFKCFAMDALGANDTAATNVMLPMTTTTGTTTTGTTTTGTTTTGTSTNATTTEEATTTGAPTTTTPREQFIGATTLPGFNVVLLFCLSRLVPL